MGGEMSNFIDPFGAAEYFCTGLAYLQMAGPGIIRFVFYEDDGEPLESIVRVKLLLPIAVIAGNELRTKAFLAKHVTGMPMPITFA